MHEQRLSRYSDPCPKNGYGASPSIFGGCACSVISVVGCTVGYDSCAVVEVAGVVAGDGGGSIGAGWFAKLECIHGVGLLVAVLLVRCGM